MSAFLGFLAVLVEIYVVVMIAYALSTWFPTSPGSAWARVTGVLAALCEPVLRPLRRLIPPVRAGGASIDLSVLIVIIVAQVVVVPILRVG
jgi:YggT family protein